MEGAILFLVASTGWGCKQREGQDEGWELDPYPYPARRGLETQAMDAQPRPSLSPISTCPGPAGVWHSSSSLLPHVSLGPGIGNWALPEDVKGSSQIQGLGGGSGVVLRPGGGKKRKSGLKEKSRTPLLPGQPLSEAFPGPIFSFAHSTFNQQIGFTPGRRQT